MLCTDDVFVCAIYLNRLYNNSAKQLIEHSECNVGVAANLD